MILNLFLFAKGMRDSGGHGGSSRGEINVPLIFLGPTCSQTNESFNQIDIPATLSVLFGLPIPASSIGVIIPNLLTGISMEQKLFAYYYNGQRLLQKLAKLDAAQPYQDEGRQFCSIICPITNLIFMCSCRILYTIHDR